MIKQLLSILFIIVYLGCFSQNKNYNYLKKYSASQIIEDIDFTEKYLSKFHPDAFKFISKDSLHVFVEYIKSKVDSPLTEMQERFYIKQIVAKIGCGHTDVAASKKYTKAVSKLYRPVLPLNTFICDTNKLFVLNNLSKDTTIKPGDEILSIDNHSINTILKTIYSITTSDGKNETYKKQGIRFQWFKYYYSFCFGFKLNYQVKIKHKNNSVSNYNLEALSSLKDTLILPKKDSLEVIRKIKYCSYSILKNSSPIALINIDAFKGRHWHRFYRKIFKDIKQKNIKQFSN